VSEAPKLVLGGMELTTPANRDNRMAMVIWGKSGCGKTTLAATAPGVKLWINYDPNGTDSIGDREDVIVLDLAKQPVASVERFANANPMQLEQFLSAHPEVETIVFDSVTAFRELCLAHAPSTSPKITVSVPGKQGYGLRNRWTLAMVRNILGVTMKMKRHVIFICHEDVPLTDEEGRPVSISVLLGGSLVEEVPLHLSEVWHMKDQGTRRTIAVRPYGLYAPMKTRMFLTTSGTSFDWLYNADTRVGPGISDWYDMWKTAGWKKIPIPKTAPKVEPKTETK
jgi:hypothetical protein